MHTCQEEHVHIWVARRISCSCCTY